MHIEDFVGLAREYAQLGWSVQEQLENVIDGEDLEDQNPNALKMIRGFLKRAVTAGVEDHDETLERVTEYLDEMEKEIAEIG